MAYAAKLLNPIRQSLAAIATSTRPVSRRCKTIGCMLGVSVAFGSICFRPHVTYAMDDILLDDYRVDMSDGSNTQEDPFAFWTSLRKFWFPASFILTVLINWDHPFLLGIKIILLLISTKPSTLSVYLYVEQFSHQLMRQKPHLFLFKTIYANKVEVQDYKLLCLARVQVIDQKMTLVGILGGWWAVPSSQGVLSELRTSLRNKVFSLQHSFKKSHDMSFEFTKF